MEVNRRDFNKIILSTTALVVIPKNIFAAPYSRPINWAGTSFLVPFSRIEAVMPITKGAFEMPSEIIAGATFFNASLYNSLEKKPIIKNLVLDGFDKEAKLSLTLAFSAEFDLGGFEDPANKSYMYILRTFAHAFLYNPEEKLVVSSVPVRGFTSGAIDIDATKKDGWKSKVIKDFFYNTNTPDKTILEQFRIMTSKLSLTNKWRGKAPRVTSVTLHDRTKKLFNNSFDIKSEDFVEFLGQASTAAFTYQINNPIMPYSVTESTSALISVFNDTTKMFQEIETELPKTEISIKILHKGWKFKEKPLTPPMQQVTLYMGLKIEIFDVGFNEKLYSRSFSASKRYVEDTEGTLRSDAGEVSILTEGLLERVFKSIVNDDYRKNLAAGEILIKNKNVSEKYKLVTSKKDPDHFNKTIKQSKNVMEALNI